jgi:feruloyl esterase
MPRIARWLAIAGAALCLHVDVKAGESSLPDSCTDIGQLQLSGGRIITAEFVPAGDFIAPDGKHHNVRSFCRVHGVSKPTSDSEIHFELWLPASGWNGRYYQHGEGGGSGFINYDALAGVLSEGAAAGATDNGHRRDERSSYDWAYGHPERIVDLGYRALGVTREIAQEVVQSYYGKAAHHHYFAGCSGGGVEGLMAAQRFPTQWDGIIVGAPNYDAIGFFASSAWLAHRWLTKPEGRILPAQLSWIERAALASCSAEAHVESGIAADPRHCRFDPRALSCKGAERERCLSASQVETLRMIYQGPRMAQDQPYYLGFPATLESGWPLLLTGGPDFPLGHYYEKTEPATVHFAVKFFRAFVFEDAGWDLASFQLDRDVMRAIHKHVAGETLATAQNATDTNLTPLRDAGAKLMMYVGWGDAAISPLQIIAYYESIAQTMGGTAELDKFSRLYVVPGMGHCGGGAGANAFGQSPLVRAAPSLVNDALHNMMRALEAWAEGGSAPGHLIGAKYVGDDSRNGIAFTRPICPYPLLPVYGGSGSRDIAGNFRCVRGR